MHHQDASGVGWMKPQIVGGGGDLVLVSVLVLAHYGGVI